MTKPSCYSVPTGDAATENAASQWMGCQRPVGQLPWGVHEGQQQMFPRLPPPEPPSHNQVDVQGPSTRPGSAGGEVPQRRVEEGP